MSRVVLLATLITVVVTVSLHAAEKPAAKRPNVVLVMTDDQGYGDMGCHGNRVVKTVALDMLHRESIRLTNFHVDPTCSPTRAALLTGRYSARTGVWHTIMGRSILRRDEVTMADLLGKAGYKTAIFGKWHLGDNYPYRAMDRGFQESLVHGGGGIGNLPDYWGNMYTDPTLCHNGRWEPQKGYCTDIFFDAAIRYIDANRREPFFVYIPTNVPHGPLQVPEKYSRPYLEAGVKPPAAAFYGMVQNFDENLGKLLTKLDEWKLADNTIVIFMTDNGSASGVFNAGMRGTKGAVYEGGHRVPCFIRWPARLKNVFEVEQLTAHIDLLPTLIELCGIPYPKDIRFDGRSLMPLLVGLEDWAPRTLFVQSHRIETPQPWRNSAVMTEQYRLIDGRELFDIRRDPEQSRNIAGREPQKTVDQLRFAYEEWYKDVGKRFDEYCEIVVGSPKENPTELNAMDWHGPNPPWDHRQLVQRPQTNGFWAIEVERAGRYQITLRERPAVAQFALPPGSARLKIGDVSQAKGIASGATGVPFELNLKPGKTRLEGTFVETTGAVRGAYYVEVRYLEGAR